MKALFGFGLILVIAAIYGRYSGRLSDPMQLHSLTGRLVEPPRISTGKHGRIILSLSYERCKFRIDGNAESIIYSNDVSLRTVDALQMGDEVTVWYPADDEPSTHSYLHIVDAFGLAIHGEIIVDANKAREKNDNEYWWMLFSGTIISAISVVAITVRRYRHSIPGKI